MSDLRPALRAFLIADPAIEALVKTGSTTRIYPIKMPQGVSAASIVYNDISAIIGLHNQGSDGLTVLRIQIAAWAKTADEAQALALAVKERLHGYAGYMGSGGSQVWVQLARFESWRDQDDTGANLRGKVADYIISYDE
jgi:hypothetical protein